MSLWENIPMTFTIKVSKDGKNSFHDVLTPPAIAFPIQKEILFHLCPKLPAEAGPVIAVWLTGTIADGQLIDVGVYWSKPGVPGGGHVFVPANMSPECLKEITPVLNKLLSPEGIWSRIIEAERKNKGIHTTLSF